MLLIGIKLDKPYHAPKSHWSLNSFQSCMNNIYSFITQFRPISLCNTLYKLLSRILVRRLKPYIAEIINRCQAGFVPGRRTSDNIILVQEVIRTLRYRKGRTRYVAIKLDLENAYDRLEWSFIQDTLNFFQFPPKLITLIMNMISSTRFHILWNGTPLRK